MSNVSVLIPTYKPRYLENTLEALSNQTEKDFEVVVVENGIKSKEAEQALRKFSSLLDTKYLFESRPGVNLARNIGCQNSFGEVIALTDDDCLPNSDWISEIKKAHISYPSAGVIGGKVNLNFIENKPNWLQGVFRNYLAELNLGEVVHKIEDYEYLVGANFTFRRDVFDSVGGFDIRTGLVGDSLMANDEFTFLDRSKEKFSPGAIYVPEIVVTHKIPKDRTTTDYFLSKAYNQGRADIFLKKQMDLNFNIEKAYTFLRSQMEKNEWDWEELNELEKKLESKVFKEYEKKFLASRVEYLKGVQSGINNFVEGLK
ncbi:MAG: glycosyltransferase family A protein [Candidatus Woesearchaeota archaeon]